MVKSELKIQTATTTKIKSNPSSTLATNNKKKYKGVRMRSWGSWVSEIRAPNQKTRIWLGSYSTAEAAARAYDAALLCLKGSSANLNFPITPSHYIPDTVMSPKSIQRVAAAAAAANSFNDNAITNITNTTPESPSPSPSSTSTSSSSSTISYNSSSPNSDQLDVCDDGSLNESLCTSNSTDHNGNDGYYSPWYSFDDDNIQSSKFLEHQMFINNAFSSSPPMVFDDFFDGDFRLWSFTE